MSTIRNIKGFVSIAVLAFAALGGSQAFAGGVHVMGGHAPAQRTPDLSVIQQDQQIIQQDQQMRQNYQLQEQQYRDQDRPHVTPQQPDVPIMQPQQPQD